MKITVKIKSVYGQPRIYPVCDKAKAFARLTGHKCLSRSDLEIIETLGFEVESVPPPAPGNRPSVE